VAVAIEKTTKQHAVLDPLQIHHFNSICSTLHQSPSFRFLPVVVAWVLHTRGPTGDSGKPMYTVGVTIVNCGQLSQLIRWPRESKEMAVNYETQQGIKSLHTGFVWWAQPRNSNNSTPSVYVQFNNTKRNCIIVRKRTRYMMITNNKLQQQHQQQQQLSHI